MDSSTIEHIRIEVASFERAILDTIERIYDHTQSLQHVGITASEVAADGSSKDEYSLLFLRASKLRATTVHGLLVLQELAVQTGRLEVLAHLHSIAAVDGADGLDDEG